MSANNIQNPDLKDNLPLTTQKGINPAHVLYYLIKGLNDKEISEILKCSRENIKYHRNRIGWHKDEIRQFKEHRADIQAFIQSRLKAKQIEYLTHESTKIESWKDYRDSTISSGTEQDKEIITINMNQNITVNREQLIAEFKEMHGKTIDITPNNGNNDDK